MDVKESPGRGRGTGIRWLRVSVPHDLDDLGQRGHRDPSLTIRLDRLTDCGVVDSGRGPRLPPRGPSGRCPLGGHGDQGLTAEHPRAHHSRFLRRARLVFSAWPAVERGLSRTPPASLVRARPRAWRDGITRLDLRFHQRVSGADEEGGGVESDFGAGGAPVRSRGEGAHLPRSAGPAAGAESMHGVGFSRCWSAGAAGAEWLRPAGASAAPEPSGLVRARRCCGVGDVAQEPRGAQ